MQSKDEIVATLNDFSLYQSDLPLLEKGQWLNDSLLNYGAMSV